MLIGERLLLRDVSWGDLSAREAWFADPEITRYLGLLDGRVNVNLKDTSGTGLEWTVALRATGEPVGIAQLGKVDPDAHQAAFGIVIGRKDLWGQGLGREVIRVVTSYGFQVLDLNRIYLTVEARHTVARALYEQVGFKEEGQLRQARMTTDGLQNVIIMGLLRKEWEEALLQERVSDTFP